MITLLKTLGDKVSKREISWQEATDYYNRETGENLTRGAIKSRYYKLVKKLKEDPTYLMDQRLNESETKAYASFGEDVETYYADGSVYASKLVNLPPEKKQNQALVLKEMGFDPNEWQVLQIQFSQWEQHTKTQLTKNLYSVKVKLSPKEVQISREEALKIAEEYFSGAIKPLELPKVGPKFNNKDLMIECPGIELHLGKLAHYMDTGENYDHKIAEERFEEIISELVKYQINSDAANLTIFIGNDFFNSDTPDNTTTAGTQMQNDLRYKKMFLLGLKMYTEAFYLLRENFDKIDVKLQPGNHDEATSFYLYIALSRAFQGDDIINFSDDYKAVQVTEFGKCALFTAHGNFKGRDYKKLIQSIAYEFAESWGRTEHRELHLGHLHTELMVDENSGLIVRRVPSPSGTDNWHQENRFIGSRKAHQLFLWHKEYGMINSHYVVFPIKKEFERTREISK